MKRNLKPGDVITFPSLEEMCPQHVGIELKRFVDDKVSLTDIYKINVIKNGIPASMTLLTNTRYIVK